MTNYNIEEAPLYLKYLVTYKLENHEPEEWHKGVVVLENLFLNGDLFQSAPVAIQLERLDNGNYDMTYHMPLSEKPFKDLSQGPFGYIEELALDNALVIRQADRTEDFDSAIKLLENEAAEHQVKLTGRVVMIVTEVYQQFILDIFAETDQPIPFDEVIE